MKISFATSGGQGAAAYLNRPPRVLDLDTLAAAHKAELLALLAAAAAEAKSHIAKEARGGDLMSYTVEVEDGEKSYTLKQSDAAMPHAFARLLDWLQAHFAKR